MATPAAVLAILVEANTTAANSSLAKTQAQLKRTASTAKASNATMASSFATAGGKMKAVGGTLTKSITLPVIALGAIAIKSSLDFNHAMNLIQTTAGASAKEVQRMKQAVLDFAASGKTEFSPNELAAALYNIESAGIRGKQALQTLKKSSELASLGQADLESTTKALVAAQKTGIKGSGNLTKELAILNSTVGSGILKFDDLVGAMGTGFLASAKSVGLSLEDVGGALAELTKQGTPAQAAATRLRQTFSLIAAPTTAATTALKSIGLSQAELALKMRGPGGLPAALTLLKERLGATYDLKTKAGLTKANQLLSDAFGGARSGTTIKQLLFNLGDLKKVTGGITPNIDKLHKSINAVNADPAVQLRKAFVQIQAALVRLGDVLIPVVVPALVQLAGWIASAAQAFDSLSPNVKRIIVYFALAAAAAGPLLTALGFMVTGIGALAGSEVALAIAALVALGVAFVVAYEKSAAFRDIVDQVAGAVKSAIPVVVSALAGLLPALKGIAQDALIIFKVLEPVLKVALGIWLKVAIANLKGFLTALSGAITVLRGVFDIVAGILTLDFGKVWAGLKEVFGGLGKLVLGGLMGATAPIRAIAGTLFAPIIGALGKAVGAIVDLFGKLGGWIWDKVKPVVDILIFPYKTWVKFVIAATKDIVSALGKVAGWIGRRWGPIGHVLGAPFRFLWKVTQAAFGKVVDFVGKVLGKIADFVGKAAGFIRDKWGKVKDFLAGPFRAIGGFVRDRLHNVIDAAKTVIKWVKDKWGKLKDFLTRPFEAIAGKISGIFGDVKKVVLDAVNFILMIIGHIPGLPNIHLGPGGGSGGGISHRFYRDHHGGRGRHAPVSGPGNRAKGGHVSRPELTMIGEDAPRYPEFVIPTNPKHRKRAMKLWEHAGRSLGVRGAAAGASAGGGGLEAHAGPFHVGLGPFGPSAGVGLSDAAKEALKTLLDKVPLFPKGWDGLRNWLIDQATSLIDGAGVDPIGALESKVKGAASSAVKALVPGMATGGVVGAGGRDTELRRLAPGEVVLPALSKGLDITGAAGKKLEDGARKTTRKVARVIAQELKEGHKGAEKETNDFVKKHGDSLEKMRKAAGATTTKLSRDTVNDFQGTTAKAGKATDVLRVRTVQDFDLTQNRTNQLTNRIQQQTSQNFDKTRDQAVKASGSMRKGVVNAFHSMATGAGKGIAILGKETNTALKALGVKAVNFGTKVQKKARGGRLVPGHGSGDKVHALLEPGEIIWNREAVAEAGRKGLLDWNKKYKRFQTGGVVDRTGIQHFQGGGGLDFALGPYTVPPIKYDPAHAGANSHVHISANSIPWLLQVGHKIQQLGNSVGEFQPTKYGNPYHFGPITTSAHAHYTHDHYSGYAVDVNSLSGPETAGWERQIAKVLGGKVASVAARIKKVVLTGPDGPLKDLGNAALMKIHAAAQAYVDKKSSLGVGTDVAVGKGILSLKELGMLTKAHGMPPIMEYVAWNESGGDPKAHNASGASGLWQFLPSTWAGLGVPGSPFDPNAAATGAAKLYGQSGLTPWEASRNAGAHGGWGQDLGKGWTLMRGGLVQKLQGGGAVGKGGPGHASKIIKGKVSYFNIGNSPSNYGAYGYGNHDPGIALNPNPPGGWNTSEVRSWAGKWFRVRIPGYGKKDGAFLRVIDKGPSVDARKIDVTAKGAKALGISIGSFPTDHVGIASGPFNKGQIRGGHGGHGGGGGGDHHRAPIDRGPTGKDLRRIIGKLFPRNLAHLIKEGKGHPGLQKLAAKELLKQIAAARKLAPIKPTGHIHDYLNELDIIGLKMKLHPKSKKLRDELYDDLVEYGPYLVGALKHRGREWKTLKIKKKIAALTPGDADDKRIAAEIAKFLGKKPGPQSQSDQVALTQQFFEFLRTVGPVPGLLQGGLVQALGAGGKVRSQLQLVGERGPELAKLPGGTQVHSASQTEELLRQLMLGQYQGSAPQQQTTGLSSIQVDVYIGGQKINDIVDTRISRKGRKDVLRQRAGTDLMR